MRDAQLPVTGLPAGLEVLAPIAAASGSPTRLYLCVDRERGVELVLKVGHGAAGPAVRAEARALARLGGHRHVLALQMAGRTSDGTPWVLTDHAAGGSLASRIGAPAAEAVLWASQLGEALAHAHRSGVVHGDVTPTNVLLDERDRVLLADFGSAHMVRDADRERTHHGRTPAHAAPERRDPAPPTPESDVYGLASTVLTVCGDHHGLGRRARSLLHRCLGRPPQRPSAATLARELSGRP
ncbi:MAG: protein kinase [Microthrixaceae bacterium]